MLSNSGITPRKFFFEPTQTFFWKVGLSKNAVKTAIAEDVTSNLFLGRYSNLGSRVISKKQISAQSKNGGFLGALASLLARTVLPTVARIAPKVVAPLATGALNGLASTGVSKILGNGITIPLTKQQEIINQIGPYLTNTQINQMLKTNKLKLSKRPSQGGGFLPLLIGALGSLATPVLGSLLGKGLQVARVPRGKGLQVDAQQRPYRRVPRVKKNKIKLHNKPMSNFDIMNGVKELKIKHFDGVFNKDSRQWAPNCGIINLDSNNGPGTHWACYVDSFYFDPFGLPPPENIFLSNDTILYNIKIRYIFFVVFVVFFFHQKLPRW